MSSAESSLPGSSAGLSLVSSRDPLQSHTRYIRVRSAPNSRYVEFDFAIDDPSLFVELILPLQAFEIFCQANSVVAMTKQQAAGIDAEMDKWRYGHDTLAGRSHSSANQQ